MEATPRDVDPARDTDRLFATCYRELHRIARHQLLQGHGHATLSATSLLHDTFLGLSAGGAVFATRQQFVAYAARAMRGLVVDHLRAKSARKRGGNAQRVTLDTGVAEALPGVEAATDLAAALEVLERHDAPLAELVDLRFFGGFSLAEIASMRSVCERTVQRDWAKARLMLRHLVAHD